MLHKIRMFLSFFTLILFIGTLACSGEPTVNSSSASAGAEKEGSITEMDSDATPRIYFEASPTMQGSVAVTGSFSMLEALMTDSRRDHVLIALNDGRALSIGGRAKGGTRTPILLTAETWDPIADEWSRTGEMQEKREVFSGHLLEDGRVIVLGGADNRHEPLDSTEIWDPSTGTWSEGPDMEKNRWRHASVKLNDGRVLVVGGMDLRLYSEGEIFDPLTNEFTSIAKMSEGRARQAMTVMQDGRVLVTGGGSDTKPPFTASAEVYDAENDSWASAGFMSVNRTKHTSTLLDDGRVLIVGGVTGNENGNIKRLNSAEVYNPTSNTWTKATSMSETRTGHIAIKLGDGRVLIAGGTGLNSTEIYDPTSDTWSSGPNMTEERAYFTVVELPNGDILVNGGQRADTLSNTTEKYKD